MTDWPPIGDEEAMTAWLVRTWKTMPINDRLGLLGLWRGHIPAHVFQAMGASYSFNETKSEDEVRS